jgi:hypothetical protein
MEVAVDTIGIFAKDDAGGLSVGALVEKVLGGGEKEAAKA